MQKQYVLTLTMRTLFRNGSLGFAPKVTLSSINLVWTLLHLALVLQTTCSFSSSTLVLNRLSSANMENMLSAWMAHNITMYTNATHTTAMVRNNLGHLYQYHNNTLLHIYMPSHLIQSHYLYLTYRVLPLILPLITLERLTRAYRTTATRFPHHLFC